MVDRELSMSINENTGEMLNGGHAGGHGPVFYPRTNLTKPPKLCINCVHYKTHWLDTPTCESPAPQRDVFSPVTGKVSFIKIHCSNAREFRTQCGAEGKWFVAK